MNPDDTTWRARPLLATALQLLLLAVPFLAASLAIWAAGRLLPTGPWWSLVLLFAVGVLVAVLVERAARRLLPIALMLRLSTVFPDRAPSRFALARAATRRPSPDVLLPSGPDAEPVSSSALVLHLVTSLAQHDRRTRGHSERVRVLCDMLASELGLDDDSRARLRWAALLHDLGKVEVPATILNKPGRLDEQEFAAIRVHPEAGRTLAAPLLPWLGPWGDGIVDHHERFDGNGYPQGKAGQAISYAGRLVGLVDAFETMTAARPYKQAMSTRAAREELARCAGTQFDPVMVRAFLAISLPRVLWVMGPLSFAAQLPFLRPLAAAGSRAAAQAPQLASTLGTGALGAAGAAALVAGGLVGGAAADAPDRPQLVTAAPVTASPPTAASDPAKAPILLGLGVPTASPSATPGPVPASAPATAASPSATSRPAGGAATGVPVPNAPKVAPVSGTGPGAPAGSGAPAGIGRAVAGVRSLDAGCAVGRALPRAHAPAPAPGPSLPSTNPEPNASPTPARTPAPGHAVVVEGPPSPSSSREATFTLVVREDRTWECQLLANGDGGSSSWRACADTFRIVGLPDGSYRLRIRDAATQDLVDAWSWTVETAEPDAVPTAARR